MTRIQCKALRYEETAAQRAARAQQCAEEVAQQQPLRERVAAERRGARAQRQMVQDASCVGWSAAPYVTYSAATHSAARSNKKNRKTILSPCEQSSKGEPTTV